MSCTSPFRRFPGPSLKSKLILAAILLAAAVPGADWRASFADPPQAYDMGVYWWWFGPAVTKAEVTRELEVMRAARIGSVLIFPIYPISLDDASKGIRNLNYLSPEFLDVLGHAAREAKRLGITVDVLMGTGWPFGGPSITPEMGSKKLRVELGAATAAPGERIEAAWIVKGDGKKVDLAGAVEVTAEVRTGTPVRVPQGHVLMSFLMSPTKMQVKRPALGAEGPVMDHLDPAALKAYLDAVGEKLIAAAPRGAIRTLHSDSMEVFGTEWTPGFLDEFRRRRGYDLSPYLPALVADAGPATEDVRFDFWRTLSELAMDNYVRPLQAWCHARGVGLQAESYGSPPVDMSSFAAVDSVMGESYDWKMFVASRWASSAAHQYSKRFTSAEAYTWLRFPRYVSTLEDIKLGSDLHFACGVNKIIAHGYAYSPPAAGVPGWGYYASIMMNDTSTWWPYFRHLSDYVRRTSYALTLGKPAVDVGILLPEDDVMAAQAPGRGLNLYMATKGWLGRTRVPEFSLPAAFAAETPLLKTLLASGFTFDGFDRSLLQPALRTDRGRLEVGDVAYRIAILPSLKGISIEILERLRDFCRSGGTLIATRRLPEAAYGVQNRDVRYARARKLIEEMFGSGPADQPRRRAYGKGTAIYVPDETEQFAAALGTLHPEIRFEKPDPELVYLHRAEGARHLYFLANTAANSKRVKAAFRDGRGTAQIWNAMDGTVHGASSGAELTIDLEPHASTIVYFDPAAKTVAPKPVLRVAAERTIGGAWSLEAAGHRFTLDSLRSWTELAECKYFSGRGAYSVSAEVPANWLGAGKSVWLDLGQVREAADVRVNGQAAGVAWMTPYKLDITRHMKAGENRIEVGVTNLLINRILGEPTPDFKGLEPLRFPKPSEKHLVKEPLPSGLLGPVRLLSLTE
jgi:hypothetical protein